MTVLSEKASRGNSKALGNIYLTGRGLVGWIWTLLSGEKIDDASEKKIWKSFFDAVGAGALSEGDNVERQLMAAAAAMELDPFIRLMAAPVPRVRKLPSFPARIFAPPAA